jgi:hypothetical protein
VEIPLAIFEEITGLGDLPPPTDEADYERRKHARAPFGFRGTITYEKKGGEKVSSVVMVRDISCAGVGFLNEEPLKPGTILTMEFKGQDDRPVQVRCSVQRCATGGLEETENIVGASFEELLTKELERKVAPPKPIEPLKPAEATPATAEKVESEDDALKMIEGDDLEDKSAEGEKSEQPKPAEPATAAAAPTPVAPASATPAPAAAAPATSAPAAPAPAKSGSSLFVGGSAPKPKRTSDDFPSEDEMGKPAAVAKPVPVEDKGPVFRDVPLPPDPEPPKPTTLSEDVSEGESDEEGDSESHDDSESYEETDSTPEAPPVALPMPVGGGKAADVFARVKQLLLAQEQTIKKQQKQLKEQKAHASKEVQMLRAEVQAMKKQMAELSARTVAEDQAVADLASFLDQHGGVTQSEGKAESEAA